MDEVYKFLISLLFYTLQTKLRDIARTHQEKISYMTMLIVGHFALVSCLKAKLFMCCWHSCHKPSGQGKGQILGTNQGF
jgi:hypothetical protein